MMIKILTFNNINDQKLIKDWNFLYRKTTDQNQQKHFFSFLNYDLNKIWFDIYKDLNFQANIIIIYENDNPILLIPFYFQKKWLLRIYSFLGDREFDYKNILCDYEKFYKVSDLIYSKLSFYFSNNLYLILLNSISDEFTYHFFNKIFKVKFKGKYNICSCCESELNLSIPNKIKKRNIALRKKYNIIYKRIFPNDKSFNFILNKLFILKNRQYEKSNSRKMPHKRKLFYEELSKQSFAHLSYLKINENIASIHLGILKGENFSYILPCYEKKFAKFSPGWIHMEFLMNECSLNHINKFDLTIGNESYKSRIKTVEYPLNYFYSSSFRISLILLFMNLFFKLKNKNMLILIKKKFLKIKF